MENLLSRPGIDCDRFLAREMVGDLSDDTRRAALMEFARRSRPSENDNISKVLKGISLDELLERDYAKIK